MAFSSAAALAFWIGIYPKPFFATSKSPSSASFQQVNPGFYQGNRPLPPATPVATPASEVSSATHALLFLDADCQLLHGDGASRPAQMELLLFALGILLRFPAGEKEKHWNAASPCVGVAAAHLGYSCKPSVQPARESRSDLPGLPRLKTPSGDGYFLSSSPQIFPRRTALVILLSVRYLDLEPRAGRRYYALLLLACIGMNVHGLRTDLIVDVPGLETMALSFYVLVGYLRREKRSNEAALKYLLLGGVQHRDLATVSPALWPFRSTRSGISATTLDRVPICRWPGMADWLVILAFCHRCCWPLL